MDRTVSGLLSLPRFWHGHRMSWRFLLFCAAVIVILFGAGNAVFSSGSPDHSPAGSQSNPRRTDEEVIATPTPSPMSSEQLAACGIPKDAPDGTIVLCAYRPDP